MTLAGVAVATEAPSITLGVTFGNCAQATATAVTLNLGGGATGKHHYAGVTHDLQERLAMHNAGHVPHTSKFAPWYIETAIAFRDKEKAFAYERYLKTGAGRAYAVKHF